MGALVAACREDFPYAATSVAGVSAAELVRAWLTGQWAEAPAHIGILGVCGAYMLALHVLAAAAAE